ICRVLQAEEFNVEWRGGIVRAWAGMDHRAVAEIHGDQQLCARPDTEFARSDTDRLARRVQRCRNFAHYRRVGRVVYVENQDARMHVRASIQAKVRISSTRITKPATTGAIRAVTNVKKVLEDGRRCVHPTVEQRILADDLEIQ